MNTRFKVLYSIGKFVTNYNEASEDWSGRTLDHGLIVEDVVMPRIYSPSDWTGEGVANIVKDILRPYAAWDEDGHVEFTRSGEYGEFSTNRTENGDGDECPDGKYLADYTAYILFIPIPTEDPADELDFSGTGYYR